MISILLAKDIRQALIGTGPKGTKVKVIERPGPKLMSELAKNNPFLRKNCDRENCPYVTKGMFCNEKCYKEGIIYKASCDRCYQHDVETNREPIQKIYLGESSRTLYTRSLQHIEDYRKAGLKTPNISHTQEEDQVSSWMWEHSKEAHGGPNEFSKDYTFDVITNYRDPLSRQVAEALRIQRALNYGKHTESNGKEVQVISINRKGDFFSPLERNSYGT